MTFPLIGWGGLDLIYDDMGGERVIGGMWLVFIKEPFGWELNRDRRLNLSYAPSVAGSIDVGRMGKEANAARIWLLVIFKGNYYIY